MVPHHQTLTALTSAGLEVIVSGKINWCHFQQIDREDCSWHTTINQLCVCVVVNLYRYITDKLRGNWQFLFIREYGLFCTYTIFRM